MRCRRAALDIGWDLVRDEAEFSHEILCLYDYDKGRVYGCDEQIGYFSGDLRMDRAYDVALRASAMCMSKYRDRCEPYAAESSEYVKDAGMMRALSSCTSPAALVHAADDAYDAYKSYAVTEEATVRSVGVAEKLVGLPPHASLSGCIDLQPMLNLITSLAGEKVCAIDAT